MKNEMQNHCNQLFDFYERKYPAFCNCFFAEKQSKMNNHELLKPALTALAKLQANLELHGGPEKDGPLFEKIFELIDGILRSFGLPGTSANEKLLWFNGIPTDFEVEERMKQLHKKATEYLLSKPKSELQILREAQEYKTDPFMVLPELKISTHLYTCFVYNNMLLKKRDSIENILDELKFVNRNGYLGTLGRIGFSKDKDHSQLVEYLDRKGVRYIHQFINAGFEDL